MLSLASAWRILGQKENDSKSCIRRYCPANITTFLTAGRDAVMEESGTKIRHLLVVDDFRHATRDGCWRPSELTKE
jgi:hypothetical protein